MRASGVPQALGLVPSAYAPSLGGVEELTYRLAVRQQNLGGTAVVASMRWPLDLPVSETIGGVPVWRGRFVVPDPDWKSIVRFVMWGPGALAGLVLELRRREVDVVHVQCVSGNGLYAWIAARLLRRPLIVSLQGELSMDADGVYQHSWVLPRILRVLLRRADAVTACSQQTLDEALAFAGEKQTDRHSVVYNGVSLAEFDDAAPEVRDRPYLFGIGRQVHNKGFDVLLRAFAESNAWSSHDLVLAGDGPEHGSLVDLASALGLTEYVHFVGRTERARTAALFRGCDLFVLPSRHEPMGIVNLEAMAAVKAVIACGVGGVPEIVIDGETGVLIPSDDVEAMSGAICELLADDQRRGALAAAGRKRAQLFGWEAIGRGYDRIYQRVLR